MNTTKLSLQLRALALSFSALAIMSGCGQSAASCADVCTADTSGTCATRCSSEQTACDVTTGGTAQFQLLLTCISNANGSYTDLPSECADAHTALQASCVADP